MESEPLYLDWNATTPLHPTVLEAMARTAKLGWGNPSSVHAAGRGAAVGLHLTLTAPFRPLGAYRPIAADGTFLSLRQMLARGLARALESG